MSLFYTAFAIASPLEIVIACIGIFGLLFIVLWRVNARNYIKDNAVRRNKELLKLDIVLHKIIERRLADELKKLAEINHRDNKLIPSICIAAVRLCDRYPGDKDGKKLSAVIKNGLDERSKIINAVLAREKGANCGDFVLNSVLDYLGGEARLRGVGFAMFAEERVATEKSALCPILPELTTVVGDLGINAVQSAEKRKGGKVKICIATSLNTPYVAVYDNGAPFGDKVLSMFGSYGNTTRADEGGSGIGLYNLARFLKKYKASFLLDQTVSGGYSKVIKIIFDGKGDWAVIGADVTGSKQAG